MGEKVMYLSDYGESVYINFEPFSRRTEKTICLDLLTPYLIRDIIKVQYGSIYIEYRIHGIYNGSSYQHFPPHLKDMLRKAEIVYS